MSAMGHQWLCNRHDGSVCWPPKSGRRRNTIASFLAHRRLTAPDKAYRDVAQASCDNETNAAHPDWCHPAADYDWPTHQYAQGMEQRHGREDTPSHHIESFLIHGSFSKSRFVYGLSQCSEFYA